MVEDEPKHRNYLRTVDDIVHISFKFCVIKVNKIVLVCVVQAYHNNILLIEYVAIFRCNQYLHFNRVVADSD